MKSDQRPVLFLLLSWFLPLLISNNPGYAEGFDLQNGSTVSEDTHACDTGTTFPYSSFLFWLSVTVNALFLLYYFWFLCRIIRSGSCRERCHRLCCSRCCQAALGGCRSGFFYISFSGCLCSMVSCLRFCHRQRWNRMEEEIADVPGTSNVPTGIPEGGTTCGTLSSAHRTEAEMRTRYDVEARTSTSNVPTNIREVGATGGALTSDTQTEAEMRMLYEIEAKTNLNILHGMLTFPPHMLTVRRKDLVNDVLSKFKDPSVGQKLISTRLIVPDKDGADLGGVTRDKLTSFWSKAKEMYFPGNEAFIPYLELASRSKQRDSITLGRIFSHSTATLKSLPIQICRSTLMVMIYDTCDINPDTLLEDFLLYLDGEDRDLIRCSLSNFVDLGEDDKDRLQTFFSKYGMGINLRAASIKEHLINLAQNELCIKPKIFCENMRMGIPHRHMEQF